MTITKELHTPVKPIKALYILCLVQKLLSNINKQITCFTFK